jgi:predicted  nucleic acid-binding Zn-ribbon protein
MKKEMNDNEKILYTLNTAFGFMQKSMDENKQEIKNLSNAITGIKENLTKLSNIQENLMVHEKKVDQLQQKFSDFEEKTNCDILNVQVTVSDISERIESRKKLNWLIVGAFFTIAANIVVLLINIFFKIWLVRILGN